MGGASLPCAAPPVQANLNKDSLFLPRKAPEPQPANMGSGVCSLKQEEKVNEPTDQKQSTKPEGIIPDSNYTQFPNIVIDDYMRELSGSAFKALAVIVRSTLGWHRTSGRIAQSQIMEKTGLSKNSVKKALQELLEKGLVVETAGHTNREGALYDLNIKAEEGRKVIPEGDDSTVEYQKMTLQSIKNCTSRGSKIDPTKERKDSKEREDAVASPSSQPLSSETELPSGGNGQHCKDPVILAYVAVHVDLFDFEPQLKYPAVGARLKQLRNQFSDDQIIRLIQAAKLDTKAWYRRDKYSDKPTYDLLTLLSSDAINQIRRNHPAIFKSPAQEKPRDPCPVCGCTTVVAGQCGDCHFDLNNGDRKPETIRDWRFQAIFRGALKPRTEQEKKDAEAWHERQATTMEERKRQAAEVAA